MTFVVELVKALAWPIAAVVLGLAIRRPVAGLLDRFKGLKYGDVKAEFGAELATTKASLPPEEDAQLALPPPEAEDLLRFAPSGAVIAGWSSVEEALQEAARRAGVQVAAGAHGRHIVDLLAKQGVLRDLTADVIRGLLRMRNLVAHTNKTDSRVTRDQAASFLAMVNMATDLIDHDLDKFAPKKDS